MKIELNGYDVDNLLRILNQKNIKLYNLKRTGQTFVSFEINDRDEKKVKRYIKNYKSNITKNPLKRLPKLIVANIGLIIGVFLGSLFCLIASNYTWQILVYGTEELNKTDIINYLSDNGIGVGKINHESSEEIEKILLKIDRIAQVSVIRKGTAIIINLSEKLVYDDVSFEPITAQYKGIVTDINIITGTTNVKIGDYVNVGDILVLPFNINAQGEKVSVKPMAEIKGIVYVLGVAELSREETVLKRTGKSITTYDYFIFKKHLFSGRCKNSFAYFESSVYNEYISRVIPIVRQVTVYYELKEQLVVHDFAKERDKLSKTSIDLAYDNLVTYDEMLDEETSISIIGDKMIACTTLTLLGYLNG